MRQHNLSRRVTMHTLLKKSLNVTQFTLGFVMSVALGAVLTGASVASAQTTSAATTASHYGGAHDNTPGRARFSPLIEKVRVATAQFIDVNVALNKGWVQGTPCVSSPNAGAMGVHIVLPSRISDGVLDANKPEALIYEP